MGGYLLVGTHATKNEVFDELYLIRTDGRGNPLWTRYHRIANCTRLTLLASAENNAGQVLLTATTTVYDANNYGVDSGLLALIQPDGRVAWSRSAPATGGRRVYAGLALAADERSFWVGTNAPEGTTLLNLSPTGQELQRLPFVIPGIRTSPDPVRSTSITNLFRLSSGLYVCANGRLVPISEQGVQGTETVLPPASYSNETNFFVTGLVALDHNDVLVVSNGQLDKVTLGSSVVHWSRAWSRGTLRVNATQAARLPNGNLLVVGTTAISHVVRLVLTQLDANGEQLYGLPDEKQPNIPQPLQQVLGQSLAGSASLLVEARTGQIVVGGFLREMDRPEEVFLSAGSFATLQPATLTPLKAWPNPVTESETLTVPASFAQMGHLELYTAQGRLVRSWPSATAEPGEAHLPLQGLPSGLYILAGRQINGAPTRLRVVKQ